MKFSEVEKRMYEDEEFLKYLPILQEKYWKKATPSKKLKIFEELQRIINEVEPNMPKDVFVEEFPVGEMQNIMVTEDCILINEDVLKKRHSPYDVFTNYIFELDIVNKFAMAEFDEEFLKTDLGRRIAINSQESILKDWDNYLPRTTDDFFYQPVTWEAKDTSNKMVYNLLRYMHKNYGMDGYIGAKVTGLMLSSFDSKESKEKLEEVFKKMEHNASKYDSEKERIENLFAYLNDCNLMELSDDEFYSLFNAKLINVYEDETIVYLFGTYIKRELGDFKEMETILEDLMVGCHEEYGYFISLGGSFILVENYNQAFLNLVIYVSNIKLREGLVKEITDEKFLDEAKLCYEYMKELQNEDGTIELEYLQNALSYYDYRNFMVDDCYKKIERAIKNNRFYNGGRPALDKGDFSKYEAYLEFAYGKTFDEVKRIQFASLEDRYNKKIGGKR